VTTPDRIGLTTAWGTLTDEQWVLLVAEMIRRRDLEAIPDVLALITVHRGPELAGVLRRATVEATVGGRP
jgi:hypothetical protein